MELIPLETKHYSEKDYWHRRFQEETSYDWFAKYYQFRHLLNEKIKSKDKILILGTGTSSLPFDLAQNGFLDITATDICPNVIQKMHEKGKSRTSSSNKHLRDVEYESEVKFEVADMFDLPYTSSSFDVVLEKGTLDIIFTKAKSLWNLNMEVVTQMSMACSEIFRVLSTEGKFFSITYAQPHFRSRYFDGFSWRCKVDTFGEEGALEYFVYKLMKFPNCPVQQSPSLDSTLKVNDFDSLQEHLDSDDFLSYMSL